jgi:hypothetical protein
MRNLASLSLSLSRDKITRITAVWANSLRSLYLAAVFPVRFQRKPQLWPLEGTDVRKQKQILLLHLPFKLSLSLSYSSRTPNHSVQKGGGWWGESTSRICLQHASPNLHNKLPKPSPTAFKQKQTARFDLFLHGSHSSKLGKRLRERARAQTHTDSLYLSHKRKKNHTHLGKLFIPDEELADLQRIKPSNLTKPWEGGSKKKKKNPAASGRPAHSGKLWLAARKILSKKRHGNERRELRYQ